MIFSAPASRDERWHRDIKVQPAGSWSGCCHMLLGQGWNPSLRKETV
jgi:hypothetical protein